QRSSAQRRRARGNGQSALVFHVGSAASATTASATVASTAAPTAASSAAGEDIHRLLRFQQVEPDGRGASCGDRSGEDREAAGCGTRPGDGPYRYCRFTQLQPGPVRAPRGIGQG